MLPSNDFGFLGWNLRSSDLAANGGRVSFRSRSLPHDEANLARMKNILGAKSMGRKTHS
jgi:hypothetical protein